MRKLLVIIMVMGLFVGCSGSVEDGERVDAVEDMHVAFDEETPQDKVLILIGNEFGNTYFEMKEAFKCLMYFFRMMMKDAGVSAMLRSNREMTEDLETEIKNVLKELLNEIRTTIRFLRESSPEFKVEVDVSSDRLQQKNTDAISSVKFKASVRNYIWSQVEQKDARVLALLGDSVTTDHISPAGAIPEDSPAGRWLIDQGVSVDDFNTFGSRRGNHEVMIRGTFGNIRIRNRLVPGVEGGYTRYLPANEQMFIYDASVKYQADRTPLLVIAGKEYGNPSEWRIIAEANGIDDPIRLTVGQELLIPPLY